MTMRPWLLAGSAVVLATAAGGVALQQGWRAGVRPAAAAPAQAQAPSGAAVPVTVARVARQDVPIYTRGIGTVQAWQSVLLRARVDGEIMQLPFKEGQEVPQGAVLAIIDPRPYAAALAQAQAKEAADQATLANDRINLQRDSALARSSFQTRQQVDNDTAAVRSMEATIQGDQAAIATAQLNLSFCTIRAPIPGVAGLRIVDIGNLVHSTDTTGIVTLTQIHPIAVIFTLPQDQLPQVQAALAAGKPPVIAYASDDRTKLDTGTLLTADNTIDQSTGTIRLKAEFPNPQDRLWPGQFVNARLQLRLQHDALTVPLPAIQHGPDGLYVYVVKADDTVARQPVTETYSDDRIAVVSRGLQPGQEIVVAGQARIEDGVRVAPRPQEAKS
ncbi:MAG TPA: efflux RND transporter periplasmic adaptor subunit [Acetobacteraceae bacterium]|nr:efflux RND transporter periplasmic adaptor subunit [Acetobacteraceae bacterium]